MKIFLAISMFIGIFASCEQMSADQEITREQLDRQLAEIQTLINEGTCSNSSQCKFIPYGSKACGGPQGYLIFSSGVDEEKLKSLVEKYNKAEATYNKENNIMSDCSIPPEPQELACEDGQCVEVA